MKIEIKDKIINENCTDSYVVECKAMYGDADGYGKVEVGGFKKNQDEVLLWNFLETCERLVSEYPYGRGGGDDYNHVEGFNKWFDADMMSDEEYHSLSERVKSLTTGWLLDPTSFEGAQASFESFKVFYYDENGVKHNVEYTL